MLPIWFGTLSVDPIATKIKNLDNMEEGQGDRHIKYLFDQYGS